VRIGSTVLQGYKAEDLADAWSRYLPPARATSATRATTALDEADVADVQEADRLFDHCQICDADLYNAVQRQRGLCGPCFINALPPDLDNNQGAGSA
jgi:hypothetical protein